MFMRTSFIGAKAGMSWDGQGIKQNISGFQLSHCGQKLKPMVARVKTLTFDNGKDFAAHAYIDEKLKSTTDYFARLFASWERGSNENLNG